MNDPKEFYAQLNVHQSRAAESQLTRKSENGEESLRQFNAELLERIGDFRKRNLELASIENALRQELSQASKREAARERELAAKFQSEIEALKKALSEERIKHEQTSEEWQRKLSRMTDESWSKGLDLTKAKASFDEERSALIESRTQLEDEIEKLRSQMLENQRRGEKSRTELAAQLDEANELIGALQQGLEDAKKETLAQTAQAAREKNQLTDQFRAREQQFVTTFDALKLDYARLDQGFKEASETASRLRTELQSQIERHRSELSEQARVLREQFVKEQHELFAENAKLKELLNARDTRNAAESEALLKWRDQLASLDSHLKGLSDLLKRGRGELLRAAKKVQDEIQFSLAHPFTEYLEAAEKEVEYLEKQIGSASQLSPMRSKQEARLQEAISHRDAIRELLEKAETPLKEHAATIQTLLRSLETNR